MQNEELDLKTPNYQVRSVSRALEILRCFTPYRNELSLSELSDLTGLNKSTILRLLDCLIAEGVMEQNPLSAKYTLGLKLFEMGMVYYASQLKISQMAKPFMIALSENVRLTCNLAVLDKDEIIYVGIQEPDTAVRINFNLGSRAKAANTSLGKVMMAELSEERIDELIAGGALQAATQKSITDPVAFKNLLKQVKEEGYATDEEEVLLGLRCMAMPIYDYTGRVIAAMSVSGTIFDFTRERTEAVKAELSKTTLAISEKLGYRLNLGIQG